MLYFYCIYKRNILRKIQAQLIYMKKEVGTYDN